MSNDTVCYGFLRRRQCLVPTWRGWVALLLSCGLVAFFAVREAEPFLAQTHPVPAEVLAIEGWVGDHALTEAVEEFHRGHYRKLYVTGGPLEQGSALSQYHTFAELDAAMLVELGLGRQVVQAVPAELVLRDRTYNSAVFLRNWLRDHHETPAALNLMTVGVHARRSRLLFQKALGTQTMVGVIALPDREYDPQHWWRYSAGVRTIINESLAYLYARFLFYPESQ